MRNHHPLFDVRSSAANEAAAIDIVAADIESSRPLNRAFDSILMAILKALSSSSVTFRTKALRALGHVITVDSNVLKQVHCLISTIFSLFHSFGLTARAGWTEADVFSSR